MTLRLVHPAPPSAGLETAGARAAYRRGLLMQIRKSNSMAIYNGQEVLAVVMFRKHGWRRIEYAMAITAAAAPFMRRLIRYAQLTLAKLVQTDGRIFVAFIHPDNQAGQRMARLVGFRPARTGAMWVFRDERSIRRRQRPPGTAQAGRGAAGRGRAVAHPAANRQ